MLKCTVAVPVSLLTTHATDCSVSLLLFVNDLFILFESQNYREIRRDRERDVASTGLFPRRLEANHSGL